MLFILLLVASAATYPLYQMICRRLSAQNGGDLDHQRIFYAHIAEACPYCGSKDLEHLGGDKFRCEDCVWREDAQVDDDRNSN